MGRIVSAVTTSHILMSPVSAPEPAGRVLEGMLRIGRFVRESSPDVIVVISNDHMFNLGLDVSASFLVGGAARFVPFGEMDIPREEYRGLPEFARGLARGAAAQGLDMEVLEKLAPDHGTAVPLLFANSNHDAAIVPLLVNHGREPSVSARQCWRLGELLRKYIVNERPPQERVAILGTGGLSHWVGYEGASVNEDFDRDFLNAFERGDLAGWRDRSTEEIMRAAGNGGVEIMNWLMVAAAVPEARAELVYYEPMPSWLTGMGGAVMHLQGQAAN